jgi:hypothetical protein
VFDERFALEMDGCTPADIREKSINCEATNRIYGTLEHEVSECFILEMSSKSPRPSDRKGSTYQRSISTDIVNTGNETIVSIGSLQSSGFKNMQFN